jgi:hypothetical protein
MPILSVFFIRTALIYLALGFTYGAFLLTNKGVPFEPGAWNLLNGHIEFLMIGWIVQLIMGVAYWILPRFSKEPTRGNELLPWLAYLLINVGIWMDIFSPLFHEFNWLPVLGKLIQTAAGVLFLLHAWPRVKSAGS